MKLDPGKHHFIRLERVRVNVQESNPAVYTIPGTIENREYYGLYIKYYINAAGQTIKVIEKNDGISIYDAGEEVKVFINPSDIMSYQAEEPAADSAGIRGLEEKK